jgi:hypothetical protein
LRRTILALGGAALVAAACGGGGGPDTAPAAALEDAANPADGERGGTADPIDLLTTANGATLVSGAGEPTGALGLIDGDPDDNSWRTDHPREVLPVSLVFELIAPARLEAVGVDNAIDRPRGVEGGAARSIRFEGSAEGPAAGYVALATLEADPDARTIVPVTHVGPVRWIRVSIDTDHGGGTWVYLDEVIALGRVDPVPSDDGRFTGRFD